jgi:hypothetical protein
VVVLLLPSLLLAGCKRARKVGVVPRAHLSVLLAPAVGTTPPRRMAGVGAYALTTAIVMPRMRRIRSEISYGRYCLETSTEVSTSYTATAKKKRMKLTAAAVAVAVAVAAGKAKEEEVKEKGPAPAVKGAEVVGPVEVLGAPPRLMFGRNAAVGAGAAELVEVGTTPFLARPSDPMVNVKAGTTGTVGTEGAGLVG